MLISQEAEGFTSQTHSHTHVTDTDLVCTGFMCWTHIWLELDVIKAHVECCLHFVSNVPLKLGLICESTNTIWPSTSYVVPGFQLWWHLHCFWHSHIHIIWSWSVSWASRSDSSFSFESVSRAFLGAFTPADWQQSFLKRQYRRHWKSVTTPLASWPPLCPVSPSIIVSIRSASIYPWSPSVPPLSGSISVSDIHQKKFLSTLERCA